MKQNLVLCGFMGSGKTVTGRLLAELLHMQFVDLDKQIEALQHLSVREIFQTKGEAFFRKAESDLAKELSEKENLVIACGGGTVLAPENVAALKAGGLLFFLDVRPETVRQRLKSDTTRPLLAKDKAAAIDTLLAARLPVYRAAADYTVDANRQPQAVADEIAVLYKQHDFCGQARPL